MKIFITSESDNLQAKVDPKFGRCEYYIIHEKETGEYSSAKNPYREGRSSVGISVAQLVINSGCSIAISGNFGPNAFKVLKEAGVKTYRAENGMTVKEAIDALFEGKLKEVGKPTSHEEAEKIYPHHHYHDEEYGDS